MTSRRLRGTQQGEGQDFSKHDKFRLWLYGDRSEATFVLRLAPSIRTGFRSSFRSARPFDDPQAQKEEINVFENLRDFYEYTRVIDFDGWKLIEIGLQDLKRNEYPDGGTQTDPAGVVPQFGQTDPPTPQPPATSGQSPRNRIPTRPTVRQVSPGRSLPVTTSYF